MSNPQTRSARPAFYLAGCAALLTLPLLTACESRPASQSMGAAPAGTDPSGRVYSSPQGAGPAGINQHYYQGADPNLPRGTGNRSRGP